MLDSVEPVEIGAAFPVEIRNNFRGSGLALAFAETPDVETALAVADINEKLGRVWSSESYFGRKGL